MAKQQMKPAAQWVEEGVPLANEAGPYVRWVAQIQEDAVLCYETTAVIEELEAAFTDLESALAFVHASDEPTLHRAFAALKAKMAELSELKVPS